MPARLTLFLPQQAALVRTLWEGTDCVLGRDPECAIVVDDERISRLHARFRHDGSWFVVDLESKNGILVDGSPADVAPLPDRTWLSLGGVLARFETMTLAEESAAQERQLSRWRTSVELRRNLSPSLGLEPLLQALLDSVIRLAETRRGFVLLHRPDGELEVCAARNLDAGELLTSGFSGSVGAVSRALELGRPVALGDAVADTTLGGRQSVLAGGIRALVCLPLNALGRLLGAVYADSDQPGKNFSELDLEILEAFADHAALAICVARLDQELEGLASHLTQAVPQDTALRERLGAKVDRARRRWLPLTEEAPAQDGASAPAAALPTWSGIVEAHESAPGGSNG